MARAISLTLTMMLVLSSGCVKEPERDLLAEAEQLYLSQKYDEAVPLLKQHLVRHPDDSGAHFYLGTCYLSSAKNAWLGIARGELETALALFERQGKANPIPRFTSATYFELICHVNMAKIYLRLIVGVLDTPPNQLPTDQRTTLQTLAKGLVEQYEAAREVDPDHKDVQALGQRVEGVKELLRVAPQTIPPLKKKRGSWTAKLSTFGSARIAVT